MSFKNYYNTLRTESNVLNGGVSTNKSLEDIAKKHKISLSDLKAEHIKGISIEMEHTSDKKVASKIAKDHLFEDPNYYKKLKKYVENKRLNFNTYILCETALEDIGVTENAQENIEMAHELEYKLSKIVHNKWSIHPKLFKNLVIRTSKLVLELYEDLIPRYNDTFESWRNDHRIQSAKEFANMVIGEIEDAGIEDAINKHGIVRGGYGQITPEDAYECLGEREIKLMMDEIYDPIDYFLQFTTTFINSLNIDVPEEISEDSDAFEEFSKDYIVDNDMEEEFKNFLSTNYTFKNLFSDIPLTPEMWRGAIEQRLYTQYVANIGYALDDILENIAEHFERVNNIDVNKIQSDIEAFSEIPPDSDEIEESAKNIYFEDVSPLLRVLSLAMNIDHVSGNIISDRGRMFGLDVSKKFYDRLAKRDTADWDEELKRIIRT